MIIPTYEYQILFTTNIDIYAEIKKAIENIIGPDVPITFSVIKTAEEKYFYGDK